MLESASSEQRKFFLMPRVELDERFQKIDALVAEINILAPADSSFDITMMRADLAGLLVVAIAASYEYCVKDIIFAHANSHHSLFGQYTERYYKKLSSRIRIHQLAEYCGLFDPQKQAKFKRELKKSRQRISQKTGKNIESAYDQILEWRHDFAHAWNRSTTIEEAIETHRFAKRIIYLFDRTLNVQQPTPVLPPIP
jgi:hypothetical protein